MFLLCTYGHRRLQYVHMTSHDYLSIYLYLDLYVFCFINTKFLDLQFAACINNISIDIYIYIFIKSCCFHMRFPHLYKDLIFVDLKPSLKPRVLPHCGPSKIELRFLPRTVGTTVRVTDSDPGKPTCLGKFADGECKSTWPITTVPELLRLQSASTNILSMLHVRS